MKGIKRKIFFICLTLVTVLVFCFICFNINKGDKEDVEDIKVKVSDVESIEWHLYDNLFQDDW